MVPKLISVELSQSLSDSHIRNRNDLFVKSDIELEARKILETGKALGVVPRNEEGKIIEKLVDMEVRDGDQCKKNHKDVGGVTTYNIRVGWES